MPKFKDLIGQHFGRLTVIERAGHKMFGKQNKLMWRCVCECGNEKIVSASDLTNGRVQSCGCLYNENRATIRRTHGLSKSKIYDVWCNMKDRCLKTTDNRYKDYGGRGITIYPAWIHDFKAFYNYVSKLPHFGEKGYSLDRIDNNGNYEPNNLRWATAKEQTRNQRTNVIVEYQSELMILEDAAQKSGINRGTLFNRIKHGDTGESLFRPVAENNLVYFKVSADDVIKIRELYSTGNYSQSKLAAMFNVSQPCISDIVNYKKWKNI